MTELIITEFIIDVSVVLLSGIIIMVAGGVLLSAIMDLFIGYDNGYNKTQGNQ